MLIKKTYKYFSLVLLDAWLVTTNAALAGGSVTLRWNPSTSSDVMGYYIYYGLTSGIYDHEVSVGNNTTVVITNLVEGATYYFAATSHDGGESPFSNEASYTVPLDSTNLPATITLPINAGNGRFSFNVSGQNASQYVVEASTDLVHWVPVATNPAPFTFTSANISKSGQQFFRAVLFNVPTNAPSLLTAKLNVHTRFPGQFSFEVQGISGQYYIVESSADLKNWIPVMTNGAPFIFTATNVNQTSQQFYRAVLSN